MLGEPYLIRPAPAYQASYLAAYDEGLIIGLRAPGAVSPHEDFAAHLRSLDHDGQGSFDYHGHAVPAVPSLCYWLVEGTEYLGSISIRARLDSPLLAYWGGHIGYGIRPSAQGKGYGKRLLALGLDICKGMGIPIVRISCDPENLASRRIIEACGGILLREYRHDGQISLLFEHILLPDLG